MKRVIRNNPFGKFGSWVPPQHVIRGSGPSFPNQWVDGIITDTPTKVPYTNNMADYLKKSFNLTPISNVQTLVSGKSIGLYSTPSQNSHTAGLGDINLDDFGLGGVQDSLDKFESATKITLVASVIGAVAGVLLLLKK